MKARFSVRKLSELSGVNIETVRYYEHVALLPEPQRATNGYRQYGVADAEQLSFIRRARELGFTLDEIRKLLALASDPSRSCAEADDLVRQHLMDIEGKLRDLKAMQEALAEVRDCTSLTAGSCQLVQKLSHLAKQHVNTVRV